MKPEPGQIKSQLAAMRLVYYALTGAIVLITATIYFLVDTGGLGPADYSLAPLLQIIAMIIIPSSLAAGYFVFRSGLGKIESKVPLTEKLSRYFVLMLIRAGIFETGFLFCVVATILTREVLFLAAAPVILFIFLLLRPSSESIAMDLNLSGEDRSIIDAIK